MDERPIIRCISCRLNQFGTKDGLCRRCRKIAAPKPVIKKSQIELAVKGHAPVEPQCGFAVWAVRTALGLTQLELASRSAATRQWICKVETGAVTPTVDSLQRLVAALDYPSMGLIRLAQARAACLNMRAKAA